MMKRIAEISILLLFMIISAPVFAQNGSSEQTHTVQAGETLFSISREYDLTVSELRDWNNLNSDNLQPGQEIRVSPPAGQDRTLHVVEAGESLFGISRMYDVTIAEIQQWNNMQGTDIEVGTRLVIYESGQGEGNEPTPSISEVEGMDDSERSSLVQRIQEGAAQNDIYVVRSGDNLTQIARRFDMTINEVKSLNNLQSDMLRVGQRLTVKKNQVPPSVAEGAENSTPQGRFTTYRLQAGENTQTVLNKYRMSNSELRALNPGLNIESLSSRQQITILLPPTRNFDNPYRKNANLEDLGTVPAFIYDEDNRANPTTSGELYNPGQLTAAHSNIVLGSIIYVENPTNKNGVFVKINDRLTGDGLKLSHKAYEMLNFSSIQQPQITIYLEN
jgi:LysM repeat protein